GAGLGQVDPGQFVQPGGLIPVVPVPGQNFQHGGQSGGAHDGGVLPQGIENPETLPEGVVLWPANLVVVGGGNEAVGDEFVIPAGTAQRPQPVLQLLSRGIATLGGLAPHEGDGDVVVAVEPGNLLRQVSHALHVPPP